MLAVEPIKCIHCDQPSIGLQFSSKGIQMATKCGCVYSDDDKEKILAKIREEIAALFGLEVPDGEEEENESSIITPG